MKTLLIIAGIALLIFLLLQISLKARFEYGENGFKTYALIFGKRVRLSRGKKKSAQKKAGQKKKIDKEKKKSETGPPDFDVVLKKISTAAELAEKLLAGFWNKLLKGLTVYSGRLNVHFAGPDAAKTGQTYAAVSAAVFGAYGVLNKLFTIKKFNLNILPAFAEKETMIEFEAVAGIKVWRVFALVGFLIAFYFKEKGKIKFIFGGKNNVGTSNQPDDAERSR